MTKELSNYLREQTAVRGWSGRELARQAGISVTSVQRAMDPNPEKPAGYEVLESIARALRTDKLSLFVMGGLLPREPKQTTRERQLLNSFRLLPEEHQAMVMMFTDFVFTQRAGLFPRPAYTQPTSQPQTLHEAAPDYAD